MPDTRLYFAYGSNLHPARLQARTPSARILGPAELPGNRLAWHKHGVDDSGKCDIVETGRHADRVHGALYEIDIGDWRYLDIAEELGTGYDIHRLEVRAGDQRIRAYSYRALVTDPDLKPFDWYQAFVVQGARVHGLPAEYVRALASVGNWQDPDPDRRDMNRRLLRDAARARAGILLRSKIPD